MATPIYLIVSHYGRTASLLILATLQAITTTIELAENNATTYNVSTTQAQDAPLSAFFLTPLSISAVRFRSSCSYSSMFGLVKVLLSQGCCESWLGKIKATLAVLYQRLSSATIQDFYRISVLPIHASASPSALLPQQHRLPPAKRANFTQQCKYRESDAEYI